MKLSLQKIHTLSIKLYATKQLNSTHALKLFGKQIPSSFKGYLSRAPHSKTSKVVRVPNTLYNRSKLRELGISYYNLSTKKHPIFFNVLSGRNGVCPYSLLLPVRRSSSYKSSKRIWKSLHHKYLSLSSNLNLSNTKYRPSAMVRSVLKNRLKSIGNDALEHGLRISPLNLSSLNSTKLNLTVSENLRPNTKNTLTYQIPYSGVKSLVQLRFRTFPNKLSPTFSTLFSVIEQSLLTPLRLQTIFRPVLSTNLVNSWLLFVLSYFKFLSSVNIDLYLRKNASIKFPVRHQLLFRFNKHRLVISLVDSVDKSTHFFASTGLFLKYVKNRKSLKKTRALKLLMMRFLRKMFLVLHLKDVDFCFRGVPLHLEHLLKMLFRPLSHVFTDPFTGDNVDETTSSTSSRPKKLSLFNLKGVTFRNPKPYGFQKDKKKGRVKRKIRKKIMRINNITDL